MRWGWGLVSGVIAVVLGATVAAVWLGGVSATDRFFERHVQPDGRVARDDDDTVSEGQAYGMLLSLAAGDEEAFERIWAWTRANLLQPDGHLAWIWEDGEVLDTQPAPDADIDAAVALVLAADRFDRPGYLDDARSLAATTLSESTVRVGGRLVLTGGPWGTGTPAVVNPSYLDPHAFEVLAAATGDDRWVDLAESARELMVDLTAGSRLPPDWAEIGASGRIDPIGSPSSRDETPMWGHDAFRAPIRFAASCDPADRLIAARMWDVLGGSGEEFGVRTLDGGASGPANAVATVGAAASADAAGDTASRDRLLSEAAVVGADAGYYSTAWIALGPVLLGGGPARPCP